MPRTIAVDSPGCPPVRAITTDVLGLVKVVEARGNPGTPKVVETWGPPEASRRVLAASYADRKSNPLLAIARINGLVEFLNPLNGEPLAMTKVGESSSTGSVNEDDLLMGLHLLRTKSIEFSSESISFLTCTSKGKACLSSIVIGDASPDSANDSPNSWNVNNSGRVICSSVDGSEKYSLFGGKGIELHIWELENLSKIWTAKPPPCNSVGVFSPTWFTAATFLYKDDHRKIAAGTNNHQVRLYDISSQRRPVMSITFRESPIKAITEDLDGNTVYIGTGSGDLASFDMRTGKLLGCFIGKCSGGIKSITRHPKLPLIASCGLDRYLRFWDTKTRQPLSAVFLKQHLTNVVIDSHFSSEESAVISADQPRNLQVIDHSEVEDGDELLTTSVKSEMKRRSKTKTKKRKSKVDDDRVNEAQPSSSVENEYDNEKPPSGRSLEEKEKKIKLKQKRKKTKSLTRSPTQT